MLACRAEWDLLHKHSHDLTETRRLERNVEVLHLHFRRKVAGLRQRRKGLREAANTAWDKVMFLSRSVVHCVQVQEGGLLPTTDSPDFQATTHVVPMRPATAPTRDREPTPLRPIILEASAPAGTAVQLRSALYVPRPSTAMIRRGVTVPKPSPATASHTLFDPRQLMVLDSTAMRARAREDINGIRKQAVASDHNVVRDLPQGIPLLEPHHRRLVSEGKVPSAPKNK